MLTQKGVEKHTFLEGEGGGSYRSYLKNTPTCERNEKTTPFTDRFLPKGAFIPTKNPEHISPLQAWTPTYEIHQAHKPKRGEGGHASTCKKHAKQRDGYEKRPFTIRFEPKGVSIQTKRSTYSHQKPLSENTKPHIWRTRRDLNSLMLITVGSMITSP